MSLTDWTWPGARWWRCDLHVHTPASHDYTRRAQATFAEWVQGVVDGGVEVVAVTDHNTGDGIDPARQAAQGEDFVILPGRS